MADILKAEGPQGLFFGLRASLVKSVLSSAIASTTKERTKQLITRLAKEPRLAFYFTNVFENE